MVNSSKPRPPKPPKPEHPPKRKRPAQKPQTSFSLSLPALQLPEIENRKSEKPTPREPKTPPGDREAALARVLRVVADDVEEHAE
jgi:hypothetical protein